VKEGWVTKKLGEVCELAYGKALPDKDRMQNGKYPAFGANGIKDRTDKFLYGKPSIIIGRKGSAGELCLTDGPFWALDVTYYVKHDPKEYDLKFLYYLLSLQNLPKLARGVKPGINREQVSVISAPIPSLLEQQHLVAILDTAFADLAKAKANAEKNLANAKELFESYLHEVFSKRGEGWVEKSIGDICSLKSGTSVNVSLEKSSGDLPYLKVADMTYGGNEAEITTSSRFLNMIDTGRNSIFPVGTTIFPKRGGAILTNKKRLTATPICADLNIMGVIPPANLSPRLLYYYFLNVDMRLLGSGSSIPQINNYDIAPLTIAFPKDQEQQNKIVKKLDGLSQGTQHLESLYQRKLTALDELKQSILRKAFSGEL